MLRSVLFDQRKRRYAAAFHVVEFSIQDNHLHLIVEATGDNAPDTLRAGVTGLMVAFAKRLNMMLGRKGKVWGDRWHGQELPSPQEVRHRLVYVFRNVAKHGRRVIGSGFVDPLSSAWRFKGWTRPVVSYPEMGTWPAAPPRTWLLEKGWKIHGLIDTRETSRWRQCRSPRALRGCSKTTIA
jgi:hypothetical protein